LNILALEDERIMVIRPYKGLYFGLIFDEDESELALIDLLSMMIDSIESMLTLSDLEIQMNMIKICALIDEIILGGQVINQNRNEIQAFIATLK
jgi:hypothetical protein